MITNGLTNIGIFPPPRGGGALIDIDPLLHVLLDGDTFGVWGTISVVPIKHLYTPPILQVLCMVGVDEGLDSPSIIFSLFHMVRTKADVDTVSQPLGLVLYASLMYYGNKVIHQVPGILGDPVNPAFPAWVNLHQY